MGNVKNFIVRKVERKDITHFIETHHYSKNINGCITDYCFALYDDTKMIGAMFYGRMAMKNQWKKFGNSIYEVTELRRLCCIDDTPKNTESYFIGKTLRWLKKNTDIKIVVSYADEEYGHTGIIYKASNFEYIGNKKGAKIVIYNGKKYHDRALRNKYKGKLKPFAVRLNEALKNGEAIFRESKDKHCYIYRLKK